ncbi:hypothetical protein [Paenibacillus sp. GXUN7292]|uniref:hypothetical protein n=1 Tax=Paenibacillus sp. GXUN7292 TaxID=3422499 RepID=UPI003D7C9D19
MLGDLKDIQLSFNKRGEGRYLFKSLEKNKQIPESEIKIIFANNAMSKITILIIHKDSPQEWTGMIAAPANNRNEALLISNDLMKRFLQGKSVLE